MTGLLIALALAQVVAGAIVLRRLARGRERPAPLAAGDPVAAGLITILVPARDEEARIGPLLAALASMGPSVAEMIVIDDRSTDGTAALIDTATAVDGRIRRLPGRELPEGWVGKQFALQQGLEEVHTSWCLCLDADVVPSAALPDALVHAAVEARADAISAAPRFRVDTAGESLLHPALLATLVYRFGPPADAPTSSDRIVANGQCLLLATEPLRAADGWSAVRSNMTEDVALIRHLIRSGWRIGMRDAAPLVTVDMHDSGRDAWREWGRSLALPGVASGREQLLDTLTLFITMVVPPIALLLALWQGAWLLTVPAAILVVVRWALHLALRPTYDRPRATFWFAPFVDLLAVVRLAVSAVRPNRRWRGRSYTRSG